MSRTSQSASIRAPLAITDVVDSQLNPVANTGRTNDTGLALTGTGTADAVLALVDNGVDTGITASVDEFGNWHLPATAVLGPHSFTAREDSGADSPFWLLTVVPFERPAPVVIQAPGGVLNPIDAINGATVVVTYTVMIPTDFIGLSWNGLDNLVPVQPGNTLGSVTFTLPASAVAAVIGKTIPVIYTVVRKGVTLPSETLNLTVQTLPDSALEAPRILQAPDGLNLDVSVLSGDADLRVKPWPFIDAGQKISLRFEGTRADGMAYNWLHPTWQDLTITSGGEPSTTVALSDLKELKDGSSLRLIFEVSFDGGLTKVAFPIKTYIIKQADELIIDSSLMLLDGRLIHGWDPEPVTPPVNTYKDRAAAGGVLPYTYRSSNEAVAYADAITGRVFSVRNGSANITVTDRNGSITSYPVTVSNVLQIFNTNLTAVYQTCASQAANMGGHILTLDEWREFYYAYTPKHTGIPSEWCWTSTPTDLVPGTTWLFGPDHGQSLAQNAGYIAPGFGLAGLLPVNPEQPITISNMYYSTPFAPALRPLPNGGQLPPPASEQVGDSLQITISGTATPNTPFVYCISYGRSAVPISGWLTVTVPASGIFQHTNSALFHPSNPGRPRGGYYFYQRIAGQPVELPWSFIF